MEQTDANLVPSGDVVRHVLQAAHHPLVPEIVRKRFCPLGQQLHQLRRHLTEADLKSRRLFVFISHFYMCFHYSSKSRTREASWMSSENFP